MFKKLLITGMVFLLLMILITGCDGFNSMVVRQKDIDNSKLIAEKWILEKSPTYTYDGTVLTHKADSKIKNCDNCFNHLFDFFTKHTGYGDRSEDIQDLMNQYHSVVVTVKDGVVTSVIIDNEWDDMNSKEYNLAEIQKMARLKKEAELEKKLPDDAKAALKKKILCNNVQIKCHTGGTVVCGSDGKTYNNSCIACKNEEEVIWYTIGECLS